ncbi:MAG: helix-turn-helix domain-containing protein [Candidatus Binatia bacterium]
MDLPLEVCGQIEENSGRTLSTEEIDEALPLPLAIDVFTRARIHQALEVANGNQSEAARRLHLPQANLSRMMKRLGLR